MITVDNYEQISEAIDTIANGISQLISLGEVLDKNDIHALSNMFVLALCVQNDQLDEFPEILTDKNMHIGDQMQFALDKIYEEEQESEEDEDDYGYDEKFDQTIEEDRSIKPILQLNFAKDNESNG